MIKQLQLKTKTSLPNNNYSYRPLVLALSIALGVAAPNVSSAATYMVMNTNDSGTGSLRQAVLDANDNAGADEILFDSFITGSTINLNSEIIISDSLTITGPTPNDASSIILDALNSNRHIKSDFPENSGQTITLENMTIQNGSYTSSATYFGYGGGAVFVKNGDLTINHGNISNNSTSGIWDQGGGLYVLSGNLDLNNTTVSGNSTLGARGDGGGFSLSTGDITLKNSTISGNISERRGGGFSAFYGNTSLIQSTVSSNKTNGSGNDGGGIFSFQSSITLIQSSVVNNQNFGAAGGISVNMSDENTGVALINSILSNNSNTVFNTGNFHDRAYSPLSKISAKNSIFGDPETEITGENINNIFEKFANIGPLQNNGGSTLTHLPNPSSPAIDKGDNAEITGSSFDQRGSSFTRILNLFVDIGATESAIDLLDETNVITRAEIVKPILQAALIEPTPATGNIYTDVQMNSFNASWIETFAMRGFSEGCDVGKFCPNEVVTKEQLAKMIIKAKNIDISGSSYQSIYSDVPATHPNAIEIEALSAEYYTLDCAAGRYCPQETVTHEIFNNILNEAFR